MIKSSCNFRVGQGFDVHKFSSGRDLTLGGEKIDFHMGLAGHSDADALIHSIIDSLLGASNLGDIGSNFPDDNDDFKNIYSIKLLNFVNEKLTKAGIVIINIDSTIICEKPKILPYVVRMKRNISAALENLDIDRISIKGKTSEGLGYAGRGEGIYVHTVSLIEINK